MTSYILIAAGNGEDASAPQGLLVVVMTDKQEQAQLYCAKLLKARLPL